MIRQWRSVDELSLLLLQYNLAKAGMRLFRAVAEVREAERPTWWANSGKLRSQQPLF